MDLCFSDVTNKIVNFLKKEVLNIKKEFMGKVCYKLGHQIQ